MMAFSPPNSDAESDGGEERLESRASEAQAAGGDSMYGMFAEGSAVGGAFDEAVGGSIASTGATEGDSYSSGSSYSSKRVRIIPLHGVVVGSRIVGRTRR